MFSSSEKKQGSWRGIVLVALALCCALALAPFSLWLAGLFVVLSLAPPVVVAARATRARLGDIRPDAAVATPNAGMREFANLPFENPFDADKGDLPLENRISLAAESSAEFSRGVSVLYLRTPATVDAQGVLAVVRASLRPSDHAEMIAPNEIVACLNLIRDLSNVDGVIARLTQRLLEKGWPQATPPRFGRALYPMHGYSGGDLIGAARAQVSPTPSTQRAPQMPPRFRSTAAEPKPRRRRAASGA